MSCGPERETNAILLRGKSVAGVPSRQSNNFWFHYLHPVTVWKHVPKLPCDLLNKMGTFCNLKKADIGQKDDKRCSKLGALLLVTRPANITAVPH